VPRLQQLLEERKKLERTANEARKQLALGDGGNGADDAVRKIGAINLLTRLLEGVSPKDLRGLVDDGKKQIGTGIVAIVGVSDDGKAGLVVGVTEDVMADYNAVDLVKTGAEALGGQGGGGRPDMAQAGGPNAGEAQAALDAIEQAVREQAGG